MKWHKVRQEEKVKRDILERLPRAIRKPSVLPLKSSERVRTMLQSLKKGDRVLVKENPGTVTSVKILTCEVYVCFDGTKKPVSCNPTAITKMDGAAM